MITAGAGQAQMLDDFESYVDDVDLQGFWRYATLDTDAAAAFDGTQSLRRSSPSKPPLGGMFTHTDFAGPFLDVSGGASLRIQVRRDPTSVDILVSLNIRDSMSSGCGVEAPLGLVPGEWYELVLDFADCPGVDLSEVAQIKMSVSNRSEDAGRVAVNYDRLEVAGGEIFTDGFESGDLVAW